MDFINLDKINFDEEPKKPKEESTNLVPTEEQWQLMLVDDENTSMKDVIGLLEIEFEMLWEDAFNLVCDLEDQKLVAVYRGSQVDVEKHWKSLSSSIEALSYTIEVIASPASP